MITALFVLLILFCVLGIGFKITGALFATLFWLCIRLPLAFVAIVIGAACCCTILLIPVGICLFKVAGGLLIPGCFV